METVAYPMAFGHWSVQDDALVCRLPRKTVAVSAPGPLLREILRLCDGRMAWRQVAAALARQWSRPSVEAFLGQLARDGMLVEAGECLARWTDLGQVPAVSSRVAPAQELPLLHRMAQAQLRPGIGLGVGVLPASAQSLADVLRQRQSERTFADAGLSANALCTVLWAAHGVTRPAADLSRGSHRTVASGGHMHGARWFLFVLRPLAADQSGGVATAPGLYEALFHVEGGVSLRLLVPDARGAWRALLDPRVLRYASALLLPVYDIAVPARKYGNRATLFAHLEAGQSLQNAQLMATALGLAGVVRGDTVAAAVLEVLEGYLSAARRGPLRHWIPMPALVLGAKPSALQLVLSERDNWVQVRPACRPMTQEAAAGTGGFAFFAGPIALGGASVYSSGRGAEPALALRKAEAEAWERKAWATLGPKVVEGRLRDVSGAAAPHGLVAYAPRQYATRGFPLRPFSSRARYLWLEALQVGSGRSLHVPAECVLALSTLPRAMRDRAYTNTSTSGMAAWTDAEGALCRATLELIERDAFARCWIARASPPMLATASLPQPQRKRIEALEGLDHRVAVLCLARVPVPVFSVFVQHRQRPFTAITAAADFDAECALAKALDEAEGRAAHADTFPARPLARAAQVLGTAEVNRYYQTPRFHRRADFHAASTAREDFSARVEGACRDWAGLQGWLAAQALDLIAVDLTPEGAALDQGRTPLKVMRALVPGLIPIWFHHGLEPAGMPAFIAAQGAVPAPRRAAAPFVHPFT